MPAVLGLEQKRLKVPFQLDQKMISETGQFTGLASTFGNVDFGGDVFAPTAFDDTLSEWTQKNQLPLMPWFHDMTVLVGDWLQMGVTPDGLSVTGQVWIQEQKRTNEATMVHNLLTGTGPKALSVGVGIEEFSLDDIDGERVRLIEKASLIEISVVPFGMNPKALITAAKVLDANGEPNKRKIEKLLIESGLSEKKAKALIADGWEGLTVTASQDQTGNDRDGLGIDSATVSSLMNLKTLFSS